MLVRMLFSISLLAMMHVAVANNTVATNVQRIKQTCQCYQCDLTAAQLADFKPGDVDREKNPFVDDGRNMGWLSCDLRRAKLIRANLSNADFTITLRGYVTPLHAVLFSDADLHQANLSHSRFYDTDFSRANLTNAKLTHADLSLANFSGAILRQANLTQAHAQLDAMHGWGANFSGADFSYAKLKGADLGGVFNQANFSHADLSNATVRFQDSDFYHQDTKASWQTVDFRFANLRGAKFFLNGAVADITPAKLCQTTMPDGKLNNRDCGE